ncbi:MAG: cytochrome c oxidase accessory protein CcoG [Alphaproteobacteria bacterium]
MTDLAPPPSPPGAPPTAARKKKKGAASLYAAHEKVHPRQVSGRFRTIKWVVDVVLVGFFLVCPWLRWDRGPGVPDQAILLDMAGRRGYLLDVEIWPQEVYYLTGVLILGAIGLFLATALLGRVWCGFTCIQTVFTDIFQWIEYRIEGDRAARQKLDAGPWTLGKIARKTVKTILWLVVSLIVSHTWLIYFNDAPTATRAVLDGSASAEFYGYLALFAGTTFLLAGYAREQVCIYMCPWPRFQAAMFDEDSLIVTYETWRGEPRGPARAGQAFEGRGHCVDCTMCIQVCPTGIDIRDGSQLACIGCGLCIDACDQIMTRVGLPPGLITYDSTANQVARSKGEPTRVRLVRPRTVLYAGVMVAVLTVMVAALVLRSRFDVNVLHERSPLFVTMSDGSIRNGYTVKVLNMDRGPHSFALTTEGVAGARLSVIGHGAGDGAGVDLPVEGDSVGTFRVYVSAEGGARSRALAFVVTERSSGHTRRYETIFAGP